MLSFQVSNNRFSLKKDRFVVAQFIVPLIFGFIVNFKLPNHKRQLKEKTTVAPPKNGRHCFQLCRVYSKSEEIKR